MNWFGYVWIIILFIAYGAGTVSIWKGAIEDHDLESIKLWLTVHLVFLFFASLTYFFWQGGR